MLPTKILNESSLLIKFNCANLRSVHIFFIKPIIIHEKRNA